MMYIAVRPRPLLRMQGRSYDRELVSNTLQELRLVSCVSDSSCLPSVYEESHSKVAQQAPKIAMKVKLIPAHSIGLSGN